MQTHIKKIITLARMAVLLFSLAACGGGANIPAVVTPPPVSALPAASAPATLAPVVEIPGGFSAEDDAMFAVVLDEPSGMGEPAQTINLHLPDVGGPSYPFCLIPLRDGLEFYVEIVDTLDMIYTMQPVRDNQSFSAELGEYYLINAFLDAGLTYYFCLRIVAVDGGEQGVFLLNPDEYGEVGEYVIGAVTIAEGLNDNKIRLLSSMAAGAVMEHGPTLGWINEFLDFLPDTAITPAQLALSQTTYQNSLFSIISIMDFDFYSKPIMAINADLYAAAVFPGVDVNKLPETDEITANGGQFFDWPGGTRILITAPTGDGNTGYVIVGITHENDYWGEIEDFYRVEWKADGPFDVFRPFNYQLVGVWPMARYFMGGKPYELFVDQYLGPDSAEGLAALGIDYPADWLDKQGVWACGDTLLLRTLGESEGELAYILLDDNGETVTYLAAVNESGKEERFVPDGWTDLGIIAIPPGWTYQTQIHGDMTIEGDGIAMWAGWLTADSIESELEDCDDVWQFTFNDMHVGYMLNYDTYVAWLRNDWMSLNLYHGGDDAAFRNNQELIMNIARTLAAE